MNASLRAAGSDAERFRAAVAEVMGLRFDVDKLPWLERLLGQRVAATRAGSVDAYLAKLGSRRDAEPEIEALAAELCVGETYFFRDTDQFRVISAALERWRESEPERPFRVLSAGCSIGAEAHSIAIAALGIAPRRAERDVEIVGIDINPAALQIAERGSYSKWTLRETPDALREAYFRRHGDRFELDERARRMVRFEQRNLIDEAPDFWREARFDLVCCRNVLMYLTPDNARQVVHRLARSMTPDALLFLGHAENLRGVSQDFHLQHTHGTFYYSRRAGPPAPLSPEPAVRADSNAPAPRPAAVDPGTSWVQVIGQAADRIAELAGAPREPAVRLPKKRKSPIAAPDRSLGVAMEMMRQERFGEALEVLADRRGGEDDDPDALLLRAVLLATSGDVEPAEALCRRLLSGDELDAGAHYVLALCREHRGDPTGAEEHDRIAVYLDRNFAMPHLHLGLLARRSGDLPAAARELGLALELLAREQAPRIVLFGGGFSRESLMQLCRAELKACGGGA